MKDIIKNDRNGIEDTTLYKQVLEASNCNWDELTLDKLLEIKFIYCFDTPIQCLKGIELLKNLRKIHLENCDIKDISPLSLLVYSKTRNALKYKGFGFLILNGFPQITRANLSKK